MAIPVKQSGPKPGTPMKNGLHQSVVTAVRDMGEQPDSFNPGKTRHQVLVTFKNATGDEASRWYSPSWNEKANYRKDLEAVFAGADVPEQYRKDVESLVGLQCQVLATQKTNSKGYTNASIKNLLPPAEGQNVVPAEKPAKSDDDVPF